MFIVPCNMQVYLQVKVNVTVQTVNMFVSALSVDHKKHELHGCRIYSRNCIWNTFEGFFAVGHSFFSKQLPRD